MPTKKPRIQAIIADDIYETFKEICQKENRSESNMAGKIISEYVIKYELEQSEINKTIKELFTENLLQTYGNDIFKK